MFVDYRGSIIGLLGWQWRPVLLYLVASSLVVVLDRVFEVRGFEIDTLPLAVMGGAIGIFVSFRTNSCYDRWWEGRRLWGQLVNTSRHFATQLLSFAREGDDAARLEHEAIVRRHVAYVHVLRCQLRGQSPFEDAEVVRVLDEAARERLRGESSPTHALLHEQQLALARLESRGRIDGFRLQMLDRSIATLLDVQGGCERIKKTPFPPGYGFVSSRLIILFSILLPFALVAELGWATIPITALVCICFTLISEVGRVLEDPFTMFWPALPLTALSTMIEVNLRQRLHDTDLPAIPTTNARGILM